jgi:hypothetical protein
MLASSATTVEVFDRSPDKRSVITHLPSGENLTIFDGVESWIADPNRPLRKMPSADLAGAKMDADLQFPLHTEEFFGKLKAAPSEKLNGQDAYQFIGEREGQPTGRLYFGKESGLLLGCEDPLPLDRSSRLWAIHHSGNGCKSQCAGR